MVQEKKIVDGMISLLTKIRPKKFRSMLFSISFISYLYIKRAIHVLSQFRLPVYTITGKSKFSNEFIYFIFVGKEDFPLFLIDLFFSKKPKIEYNKSLFIWQLEKINSFKKGRESLLVSVDRFYERWLRKSDFFVFPHMVDMVLDLKYSKDIFYDNLSNSAKADFRKVRNKGFTYEIVSDLNKLKFFYDSMYLPLIKNRFSHKPMYTPPFTFFKILHLMDYQLLLIKNKQGNVISGCYFNIQKNTVFSRYNGVLHGDYNLIQMGAESALYYFLIEFARKNGFDKVDFGYCRPIKNDGVYRYKKKWGAKMKRSSSFHTPEVFGLKISKHNSGLELFFKDNAIIGLDEEDNFIEYSSKKMV